MNGTDLLYDTAARGAWVLVLATLPALLPALAIGLVVGLLQAATSIQEATLSFIPKLIGVFLALVLFGGVIGGLLSDYLREAASAIPMMAR
ncbi:flagellar biosynthetic protein FliQ [Sandaracinobacter neustonicus]|uniref:Flagellar biosynthetic protein FliQ n=1 Tax=Sandaracinobacter neustonicus TaxID=1715348 RepID=A0A501XHM1_9SPHN|nr:flagellar biosynthetic protein FliQ [Sandaracinobacter neustonicus]TPE60138.1 flagellar biosynthetic protein FliQ [Sandaracinobacter neustonicus]